MVSSEPDSSPTAIICTTMLGNRPVFSIARCRRWPVATSSRIFSTAFSYTMLPQAPATDSSASTSGTPAANMVDSVRA